MSETRDGQRYYDTGDQLSEQPQEPKAEVGEFVPETRKYLAGSTTRNASDILLGYALNHIDRLEAKLLVVENLSDARRHWWDVQKEKVLHLEAEIVKMKDEMKVLNE